MLTREKSLGRGKDLAVKQMRVIPDRSYSDLMKAGRKLKEEGKGGSTRERADQPFLAAMKAEMMATGIQPTEPSDIDRFEAHPEFSGGDCPFPGYGMVKLDADICFGCGNYILDRFILQVNGESWHPECLRCNMCGMGLEQFPSCYVKDGRSFCKHCYCRQYGVKCARCSRIIQPTDWVRRARRFVYHLACFACDTCKRQLSTGEEFALQDGRILCKQHYMELLEGDSAKAHQKQKTKRVRTTFTEEQVQVLQANFQIDSNPDGQDLERIAQITGLSKRVTQVWFQNSRARQKKYQGIKLKQQHGQSSSQHSSCVSGTESIHGSENSMEMELEMDMESMSPGPVSEVMASCIGGDDPLGHFDHVMDSTGEYLN